jgi:hypothetical protein
MVTSRGVDQGDHAGANGWRQGRPRRYNRGEVGIERRCLSMARFRGLFGECTAICTARAIRSRFFRELCESSTPVLSAKSFRSNKLRILGNRKSGAPDRGCARFVRFPALRGASRLRRILCASCAAFCAALL